MNSTVTETKTYAGIADAHGIESFYLKAELNMPLSILLIRANANRQRHACLYEVDLNEEQSEALSVLLKEHKFKLALTLLKFQPSLRLPREHIRSWGMIPNDKLDPYWSSN